MRLRSLTRGKCAEPLYPIVRGRWMRASYVGIRNAAWFVRNSRMTGQGSDDMLALLCAQVRRVLDSGEPLENVIAALVDLFMLDGCR
jgi:hypothetical protein